MIANLAGFALILALTISLVCCTVWQKTLRRAKVRYFRIYDLRSTRATRLGAGGVADQWVTQLLRQGPQVFKRYSQMKLQTKREALEKINRQANELPLDSGTAMVQWNLILHSFGTVGGEIGQMEQQFCWEVPYNLYGLHVGA
jgi:hypothetical protein